MTARGHGKVASGHFPRVEIFARGYRNDIVLNLLQGRQMLESNLTLGSQTELRTRI